MHLCVLNTGILGTKCSGPNKHCQGYPPQLLLLHYFVSYIVFKGNTNALRNLMTEEKNLLLKGSRCVRCDCFFN